MTQERYPDPSRCSDSLLPLPLYLFAITPVPICHFLNENMSLCNTRGLKTQTDSTHVRRSVHTCGPGAAPRQDVHVQRCTLEKSEHNIFLHVSTWLPKFSQSCSPISSLAWATPRPCKHIPVSFLSNWKMHLSNTAACRTLPATPSDSL